MAKIGEKPIIIKEGVSSTIEGKSVIVRGPLGEVKISLPASIEVTAVDKELRVKRLEETKKAKAVHGTIARLLTNAVLGTTSGFSKVLEIVGTGYRAQMEGNILVLSVGYSHPVRFTPPEGIKIEVQENTKIKVFGVNKETVGLVAENIKRIRKPDAYKGKGIRFLGEKLRLKPGKAAAKATTGGK
jgi:large subunit ribosomal protein L6